MTYDAEGAINVLKDGLEPEKVGHFQQAEALVSHLHLSIQCEKELSAPAL